MSLSVKRSVSVAVCLLSVLTVLLTSCRPHGILSSRKMRVIMVDLHKTDALLQTTGQQHGQEEVNNIYYAEVLEKHGVTQAQFDSSLVWYTAHPQLFDKIYPKVIAQLEKEEADFLAGYFSGTDEEDLPATDFSTPARDPLTKHEMDSILWVLQNGYPSYWRPLPTPFSLFVD